MLKLLSKISASLERLALATIKPLSMRSTTEWPEALLSAGILIVLVLLLTACATKLPAPCEMPPPPLRPALSEPLPLESYAQQLQRAIDSWRKKLIATPATSER